MQKPQDQVWWLPLKVTRLSLTIRFLRASVFVRKCAAKATSISVLTETLKRCKQGAVLTDLGVFQEQDCYRAKSIMHATYVQ